MLANSEEYKEGKKVAKPLIHYKVIEPQDNTYFTFPLEPKEIDGVFRHCWILKRTPRPYVDRPTIVRRKTIRNSKIPPCVIPYVEFHCLIAGC